MNDERENTLLRTLNDMIQNSRPITLDEFNTVIRCESSLVELEKVNDKIGLRLYDMDNPDAGWAISTLSIIATITDVLVDKRLAFDVSNDGVIKGVRWYTAPSE